MINLLRGELYKLFRSRCLFICSFVLVVFVIAIYGMFSLLEMIQQGEIANGTYGIVVESEGTEIASVWDDMKIPDIVSMMFCGFGTIIIVIFTSIYMFDNYVSGAIKNVVGKGYSRGTVFVSKCFSTVVGIVIMNIMLFLSVLLCEVFFLGANRLNADILVDICGYAGMQLLLGVALTGIVVLISQICRNLGAGIAISTCMIMFSSFITAGVNAILRYFQIEVNVSDYWVLDLISNCPVLDIDSSFLIRAVVCAIAWFAVALGAGSMHFGKADVK